MNARRAALALGACAAVLAGCATTSSPPPPAPLAAAPAPAAPEIDPRERIDRALVLLGAGQREPARAELQAALAREPGNAAARSLLDQIEKDPVVLLGARNYTYRVRPGESLSQIAGRLLGDPRLFYALARYNGVEAPQSVTAGQLLKVPGTPRKAIAARAPAPVQAATAPRLRDPTRASKLRGAALAHMNGGKIDRAVALLRQARELDPDNALIRRDLDRATRIQTTVRGRS
ncbi:LysM domain-containing protein [Phenylobacterium sp.]|uniref:LysM domain-containing protein n=1 Tax=Phenylobacterium sp. TaxID=1871053 RepID=UPI002F3EE45B